MLQQMNPPFSIQGKLPRLVALPVSFNHRLQGLELLIRQLSLCLIYSLGALSGICQSGLIDDILTEALQTAKSERNQSVLNPGHSN